MKDNFVINTYLDKHTDENIEEVTIPGNINIINHLVFKWYKNLKKVIIEEVVDEINNSFK